jgi:predicted permease
MTESLLISLIAAAAGLALTVAISGIIRTLPRVFDRISLYAPPLDLRILGFATTLGIVCTLLIGLLPALSASTRDPWMLIRESASGRWSGFRFSPRQLLLAVQVMLAVVLAVTGGLFARTLYNLVKVDPGFRTDHLLLVDVNATLLSPDERTQLNRDLLPSVKGIPGVISVTGAVNPPLLGGQPVQQVQIPGRDSDFSNMSTLSVTPDFFDTLGLRVIAGRAFADTKDDLERTIVVNDTFAKNMWNGQPALGKTVLVRSGTTVTERQIIGVVSQPNCWDHLRPPDPCMFNPIGQRPARVLLIRAQDLAGLASKVKDVIQRLNANVLVENVRTMDDHLRERIAGPRLAAFTTAGLAAVGVVLVAIGCFAVFTAMVKESSREIALRLALGATRHRLVREILLRATILAAAGAVAGLMIVAFVVNRLSDQFFQMKARDTLIFTIAGVGVLVLAILATFYPARAAANTDPSSALKIV